MAIRKRLTAIRTEINERTEARKSKPKNRKRSAAQLIDEGLILIEQWRVNDAFLKFTEAGKTLDMD